MADAKAKKHALDFTNVKERGEFSKLHMPEGDYAAKITKVVEDTVQKQDSQNHGEPQWTFTMQLAENARATYPYRCTLVENQLWKVRNLLLAAGKTVPKKRVNVDPNNLVGLSVGVTLADDEYEGRMRSDIDAVFPVSELADEGDEDLPSTDAGDDDEVADDDGDLDLDDL
jgi:hypothetical protein